jgi:hypothetical protein
MDPLFEVATAKRVSVNALRDPDLTSLCNDLFHVLRDEDEKAKQLIRVIAQGGDMIGMLSCSDWRNSIFQQLKLEGRC